MICTIQKKHNIISNASCTTNCLAPFTKVLLDNFGIETGLMTTVHSYTNDQKILDAAHKDLRRARAGACSIIPTTTGAAKATGLVLPELAGKLNGMSVRVPTPDVSLTDLVVTLKKETTKEEINEAMRVASETTMKGILGYSELPLVSSDYKGCPLSSIVDGLSTMMVGPKMAKVVAWYDNEWGYSNRLVELALFVAEKRPLRSKEHAFMEKKTVRDINVKGKKVLVRVDYNVPMNDKGEITDTIRIDATLPTLNYLLDQGVRHHLDGAPGPSKREGCSVHEPQTLRGIPVPGHEKTK